MNIKKEDFFKLPNILSYIRIILVPIFIYVFMNANETNEYLLSFSIVVISALTDLLDGIIARRFDIITDWGKIIDPIADKLMQAAMLFTVIFKFSWIYLLIVLFIVKEIVSFTVSALLYKKGKHLNGAIWCGKVCTVVLYLVMLIFIAVPNLNTPIEFLLIAIASLFMIISFIVYMLEYKKLYSEITIKGPYIS